MHFNLRSEIKEYCSYNLKFQKDKARHVNKEFYWISDVNHKTFCEEKLTDKRTTTIRWILIFVR